MVKDKKREVEDEGSNGGDGEHDADAAKKARAGEGAGEEIGDDNASAKVVSAPKFTFATPCFTFTSASAVDLVSPKTKEDGGDGDATPAAAPEAAPEASFQFPQWNFKEKPKEFNPLEAAGLPASLVTVDNPAPKQPSFSEAQKNLFQATWGAATVTMSNASVVGSTDNAPVTPIGKSDVNDGDDAVEEKPVDQQDENLEGDDDKPASPRSPPKRTDSGAGPSTLTGKTSPQRENSEAVNGEENEVILFKAKAKLFEFIDNAWKERGRGVIKVDTTKSDKSKARVIMRADVVYKLLLNAPIFQHMKFTREGSRSVRFAVVEKGGSDKVHVVNCLLTFTDDKAAGEFNKIVLPFTS